MNIKQTIDAHPIGSLQILVIGMCFLLNMIDGIDVQVISYSAPAIIDDWGITQQKLGVIFSAALVGMTVGAVFISPLSDKFGRRNIILFSLVLIGLGMIATSMARTVTELMILRLMSGLGIGSILASVTSLVAEFSPERNRNLCITIFHSGYPIGAILTGIIATMLIQQFGWRPLFIMAGTITLMMIPLVFLLMPESMEFLAARRPPGALEKINRTLQRMRLPAVDTLPDTGETGEKIRSGSVMELLHKSRRSSTLLLWTAFLMSFATLYFLFSWVVTLARDSGLTIEHAMYAGIAMNLGAFVGTLTLGYISQKIGLKRTMFLFFILASCLIVPYGFVKTSMGVILTLIFMLMFFVQGSFAGLYVVAARLYPTEIRTTGVGWAIGAGRLGAIFGPSAAGYILGAGLPISWTFTLFAVPLVIAGLVIARISASEID